jgi:hypothetical protein
MPEKLRVKITVTMTDEDKQNLDQDIPLLESLLKDQVGAEITATLFNRLCCRELHNTISRGEVIIWPPRLQVQKKKPRIAKRGRKNRKKPD